MNVLVRRGMRGENVLRIQELLRAAGHDPKKLDGIFGPETEDAVKAFQTATGVNADGIVGPKTWDQLLSAVDAEARRTFTRKVTRALAGQAADLVTALDDYAATLDAAPADLTASAWKTLFSAPPEAPPVETPPDAAAPAPATPVTRISPVFLANIESVLRRLATTATPAATPETDLLSKSADLLVELRALGTGSDENLQKLGVEIAARRAEIETARRTLETSLVAAQVEVEKIRAALQEQRALAATAIQAIRDASDAAIQEQVAKLWADAG